MSRDIEGVHQRDTVVWRVIRDALKDVEKVSVCEDADHVDNRLRAIDKNTLAAHFQLPVALSGSKAFDDAVVERMQLHRDDERKVIVDWLRRRLALERSEGDAGLMSRVRVLRLLDEILLGTHRMDPRD